MLLLARTDVVVDSVVATMKERSPPQYTAEYLTTHWDFYLHVEQAVFVFCFCFLFFSFVFM
jgi:hypothetical protein